MLCFETLLGVAREHSQPVFMQAVLSLIQPLQEFAGRADTYFTLIFYLLLATSATNDFADTLCVKCLYSQEQRC